MTDDKLTLLGKLSAPASDPEAQDRALNAAMAAFDEEFEAADQNKLHATQGLTSATRPISTTNQLWSSVMNSLSKLNPNLSTLATATGVVALPLAAVVAWNVMDEQHLLEGGTVALAPRHLPAAEPAAQGLGAKSPNAESEVRSIAKQPATESALQDFSAEATAPTAKRLQSPVLSLSAPERKRQFSRAAKPGAGFLNSQELAVIAPHHQPQAI